MEYQVKETLVQLLPAVRGAKTLVSDIEYNQFSDGDYDYRNMFEGIKRTELHQLISLCAEAIEPINDIVNFLEYMNKERVEADLEYNSESGRFSLRGSDFPSGRRIEVCIENVDDTDDWNHGWQIGRVEYWHGREPQYESQRLLNGYKGYYFYNYTGESHVPLRHGMRAARRF